MSSPSYIQGVGLITAQGGNVATSWNALLASELLSDHGGAALPRNHRSRVHQLAALAANEALEDAQWSSAVVRHDRTALLIGTSKGPVDEWLAAAESEVGTQLLGGVARLAYDLATELRMTGPRETWSAACASGLYALWQAQNLLRRSVCDRVLVVAAESSLHPLFIGTFDRLGVLAKSGYGCRPFDQHRDGFTMSEAAAAVCLGRSPGHADVQLERVVVASDAYHITGIDPTGETLRHVLRTAADGQSIDFVHAHGTATKSNDPVELAAIAATVGDARPHVFSHKAAFGHTQGAAGLIGIVCNVMTHRSGQTPPNAATTEPLDAPLLRIAQGVEQRAVERSLVLAAGFGSSLAAAALSNVRSG